MPPALNPPFVSTAKIALVTGAGRGIGRMIALALTSTSGRRSFFAGS